ncbi:hypothetical protein BCR42DRAFT_316577 [Absidia repens]|uniref:Amidohydrolase-related domain-containing protein n=1 Tax=Absidia repens TaxID=90262 RepID=A0A1X2IZD7_9FUNG|nr:hypothetical protein BCR42DRAFT_316577 [Absidia repens]
MNRKQQYSSISSPDEEGGQQQHGQDSSSQRSSSSLLGGANGGASTWLDRIFGRAKRPLLLLLGLIGLALLITSGLTFLLPSNKPPNVWHTHPLKPSISLEAQQAGLEKCKTIKAPRVENKPSEHRVNPRGQGVSPILLTNANVWDGQGKVLDNVDILLADGVIRHIGNDIKSLPKDIKTIDVKGHVVSPGLVDMHSHLGVSSWPGLKATDDTNEMTTPLTPFVKSIDAFNPSDSAIRIVASGGVTSALVLPGSGNLIGGEAFVFKLRPMNTTSNEDMLVQAHIDETKERRWRYEKHACGENPKRFYGGQGKLPSTRYLFRKAYTDALQLLHDQDDWCNAAEHLTSARLETRFPENIDLEALVAILRGDVKLNAHCYETHDLEAFIRHSLEFNFTIAAFHHALDAYRVPDILKRVPNNITIATFADHWGYKKEAFQASPHAPRILLDAGIPVALKSDHPVLNSQHLVFEAAKSHHYGLTEQEAFQTVTSVPANAIGLGHRIGSLQVGYDADIVIWDRPPLELGAAPIQVFVDGVPLFDDKHIEPITEKLATTSSPMTAEYIKDSAIGVAGNSSFILKNIGRNFLTKISEVSDDSMLVVDNGKIVCFGQCSHSLAGDIQEIDIQGGYVVPGFVAVGSSLGIVEISSEDSTGDGRSPASTSRDSNQIAEAVDGIKLRTRHLEEAYKGGVLSAITAPVSNNVVIGVSAAFKTGADSLLSEGSLLSSAVALHLQIGDSAKSSSFPSVSSQIAFIRQVLLENQQADNYYGKAARGDIATVVAVNNKDEIATLIRLKSRIPTLRLVILGGAEAHLLAQHLAKANIPVILLPALCTPAEFDSIHCLTGAPLTNGTAAHVLHRHGVKLGLGVSDNGLARNLAWDAGWLAATSPKNGDKHRPDYHGITEDEAIRFVSANLQEIFDNSNIDDRLDGQQSALENDFTVWSGNPFDMNSHLVLIHTQEDGLQLMI